MMMSLADYTATQKVSQHYIHAAGALLQEIIFWYPLPKKPDEPQTCGGGKETDMCPW
jgi:hypothetical protein